MKKTKIDWCDCTINPVVGCKGNCEWCYACKLNDRFHFVSDFHIPTFFPGRLEELKAKKPKAIFMDSMSDVGWWNLRWIEKTRRAMENNPQHKYIFLTKRYKGRLVIRDYLGALALNNVFYGVSVTNKEQVSAYGWYGDPVDFLSVEPILEPLYFSDRICNKGLKLMIIGAETGNRKGKVIPEKQWIDDIVAYCDKWGIKVFMKKSLKKIMGADFRQDDLPWSVKK